MGEATGTQGKATSWFPLLCLALLTSLFSTVPLVFVQRSAGVLDWLIKNPPNRELSKEDYHLFPDLAKSPNICCNPCFNMIEHCYGTQCCIGFPLMLHCSDCHNCCHPNDHDSILYCCCSNDVDYANGLRLIHWIGIIICLGLFYFMGISSYDMATTTNETGSSIKAYTILVFQVMAISWLQSFITVAVFYFIRVHTGIECCCGEGKGKASTYENDSSQTTYGSLDNNNNDEEAQGAPSVMEMIK